MIVSMMWLSTIAPVAISVDANRLQEQATPEALEVAVSLAGSDAGLHR